MIDCLETALSGNAARSLDTGTAHRPLPWPTFSRKTKPVARANAHFVDLVSGRPTYGGRVHLAESFSAPVKLDTASFSVVSWPQTGHWYWAPGGRLTLDLPNYAVDEANAESCLMVTIFRHLISWPVLPFGGYFIVDSPPLGSPSRGGDVTVYDWHKPIELAHSFLLCSCVYFCLCGTFNCISFHKFSRQLSVFSLCSSGLISALLVLSTMYLFMKTLI